MYIYINISVQGFQQKFTFHSKEIVAISCSWCKQAVSIFAKVSHHIISAYVEDLIDYRWVSVLYCFLLPVSQQNILLHAAADWRALSNRSSCCSRSSSHLDNSGSAASGENCGAHLFQMSWKVLSETSPRLFCIPQSSMKSSKKKKRTSFKRKSSKKGAEVSPSIEWSLITVLHHSCAEKQLPFINEYIHLIHSPVSNLIKMGKNNQMPFSSLCVSVCLLLPQINVLLVILCWIKN